MNCLNINKLKNISENLNVKAMKIIILNQIFKKSIAK